MRYLSFCCLFITLLFCGCVVHIKDKPFVKNGREINESDCKTIREQGKEIYTAILEKKPDVIKRMFSHRLEYPDMSPIDSIVSHLHLNPDITRSYPVGEFYIHNTRDSTINWVYSNLGQYTYIYKFKPITPDTYIYLLALPDSSGRHEALFASVFAKEDDEWRLIKASVGTYMIDREIAPYIYEKAMRFLSAGWGVPAAYYALLMQETILPAQENFVYTDEGEMTRFISDILTAENDSIKLPKVIKAISSQPQIIGFAPKMENGKIYPAVVYQTTINIQDTASLQKEIMQLHKNIDPVFPHVYDICEAVLYIALDKNKKAYSMIKQAGE